MSKRLDDGLAVALRELRREFGWTLADVAARSGIPASTLSKVENGKLSLSYDKLVRLSQGLGVDIARLFASAGSSPVELSGSSNRRSVNRAGEGRFVTTRGYDHCYLATELLSKLIDPAIVELQARTMEEFGDWVRHDGEEFAYILEGEVMFHTEVYAPLHLKAGDSIYFDSNMGHAYLIAGAGPCRVLSISTHSPAEVQAALAAQAPATGVAAPVAAKPSRRKALETN